MKIIYTESADAELNNFLKSQQKALEESIAREKFVPGDEILEITASDIKTAVLDLKINRLTRKKQSFAALISKAYIFIGLLLASGAYFYTEIQYMISHNHIQAALFASGLCLAAIGYGFGEWYRVSISRRASAEQNFRVSNFEITPYGASLTKYIEEVEVHQSRLENQDLKNKDE